MNVMFSAREVLKQGEEVGVVEEKASHLHLRQQQGDQDVLGLGRPVRGDIKKNIFKRFLLKMKLFNLPVNHLLGPQLCQDHPR